MLYLGTSGRICVSQFALMCIMLVALGGCSQPMPQVEGCVMANGAPLSDVEVVFDSKEGEDGRVHVVAMTDAAGRFRLPSDHSGPTVGIYRVSLRDFRFSAMLSEFRKNNPVKENEQIPTEIIHAMNNPRIPQPYREAATTTLCNVEVKPGVNEFTFEVK